MVAEGQCSGGAVFDSLQPIDSYAYAYIFLLLASFSYGTGRGWSLVVFRMTLLDGLPHMLRNVARLPRCNFYNKKPLLSVGSGPQSL